MTNSSLMKVESIAECSLGAFCSTFDMHYVIIGLAKLIGLFLSGHITQFLLYVFYFQGHLQSLGERKILQYV